MMLLLRIWLILDVWSAKLMFLRGLHHEENTIRGMAKWWKNAIKISRVNNCERGKGKDQNQ
jgi:hypothetical protein